MPWRLARQEDLGIPRLFGVFSAPSVSDSSWHPRLPHLDPQALDPAKDNTVRIPGLGRQVDRRETIAQGDTIGSVVMSVQDLAPLDGIERMRTEFLGRLTDEEFHQLGQIQNAIKSDGTQNPPAVTAVRLLMLTGCRLSEIPTLRWEDVNLEVRTGQTNL